MSVVHRRNIKGNGFHWLTIKLAFCRISYWMSPECMWFYLIQSRNTKIDVKDICSWLAVNTQIDSIVRICDNASSISGQGKRFRGFLNSWAAKWCPEVLCVLSIWRTETNNLLSAIVYCSCARQIGAAEQLASLWVMNRWHWLRIYPTFSLFTSAYL